MIKKILQNINLSDKEIEVYLALIDLDQAPVSVVSKKSDINRTTTYDILSLLMSKGLVSKIKKNSKTYFYALPPHKLTEYLEREKRDYIKKIELQQNSLEKILPELISMQNIHSINKPRVKFYEGEKGLREAYEDSLTSKRDILSYANAEEVHKGLPNFFPEYYKRRAALDIPIRAFFVENKTGRDLSEFDLEEMRTTKFLPSDTVFTPEINIYNNKVLIASWREKMAIIIESKEYADFNRAIFELFWGKM
jgi:sugar-specific transcriptional regulator TrmB